MAVSKVKNSSSLLTERYFNIVYTRFSVDFPEGAEWKDVEIIELPSGLTRQILVEVPYTLMELANMFDDSRVESLIPKVERLRLNNGNLYSQYMNTISTLLDNGLSWGKVVVFFAFSVSVAIFLCTHELDHLAARVCVWAAQVLEDRLQPWIDANKGWEALLQYGKEALKNKNGHHNGSVLKLGQAGLMIGVFAVAAFTIKQIFT